MRRRGWVGVAAVVAAALASTVVLVVHGASAEPRIVELPDQRVPVDMTWVVFSDCQNRLGVFPDIGWTIGQDDDGRLRVEFIDNSGVRVEDAELLAQERALNACIDGYRFASIDDVSMWQERSAAERLLILDVYQRSVRPCLAARGVDSGPPILKAYLDPYSMPWVDVYGNASGANSGASSIPLDELLAMRAECGIPSDIVTHG